MYPLKFKPIFKERLWGGQKLREVFGKDIPPFKKIGESWEISDLPQDKSVVINGELAGQTISEVIQQYPYDITGENDSTGPFPLLIKFLDAEDVLSVQVHPDPETCKRTGIGKPKTECWYIISATPEAVIYKGLKEGITRENFAQAIKDGTVAQALQKVPVKAGQCHLLPAGTAHAIGAGILLAEIQTPSDTTYRVFDWNRVDDTGKTRQLHIEQALESIHFDTAGEILPVTTTGQLADCQHFIINKELQAKSSNTLLYPAKMKVLIILTGTGKISQTNTVSVEFKAGDCILIPVSYEGVMNFAEDTQYLIVTPGGKFDGIA